MANPKIFLFNPKNLLQDPDFQAQLLDDPGVQTTMHSAQMQVLTDAYKNQVDAEDRKARADFALSKRAEKRKFNALVDSETRIKKVQAADAAYKAGELPLGMELAQRVHVCSGLTTRGIRCNETRSLRAVPGLTNEHDPDNEMTFCPRHVNLMRDDASKAAMKRSIYSALNLYYASQPKPLMDDAELADLNDDLDALEGAGAALIQQVKSVPKPPAKAPVAPKVQQRTAVKLSAGVKKPIVPKSAAKPASKPPTPRATTAPKLTLDVMQIDTPAPPPKVQALPIDKMLIDSSDADDEDDDEEDDDDDDDEVPVAVLSASGAISNAMKSMNL